MRLTDNLLPQLHDIGAKIQRAIRTDPDDRDASGWGQFLDAEGHKEQIGPYGTSGAVLFGRILEPLVPVNEKVVRKISKFWSDQAESEKLRSQNVRVAFLVLSLAGAQDGELKRVLAEAVEILTKRQRADGSWGDWSDAKENGSAPPRQETTAWILLAIHREGTAKEAVSNAQRYLSSFVAPHGAHSGISSFAAAVLLKTLPRGDASNALKSKAKSYLKKVDDVHAERISFFDYIKIPGGNEASSIKRDYLCYPAALPYAFMVSGLSKQSNWFGRLFLSSSRISLAQSLQKMVKDGRYFQLPGAAFAATVDQAAIALAFESLGESEESFDASFSTIIPIWERFKGNIIIRVVIPIAVAIIALIAIQDPKLLNWLVPSWNWVDKTKIDAWLSANANPIRLVAGLFLFFANSLPGKLMGFVREKFTG